MSADNGIYMLRTPPKEPGSSEWRVAYLMAIDNLWWDNRTRESTDDEDEHIINAREMFAGAEVFRDEALALVEAKRLYDQISYVEYGISEIKINRVF